MEPWSLEASGFERYRKQTRKEIFLEKMNHLIPWTELSSAIEPFYPKPQGAGRRPAGIEGHPGGAAPECGQWRRLTRLRWLPGDYRRNR